MLIIAAQVSGVIAVVVHGLYGSAITICFAVQGLPVTHAHPDGPVGCCSSSEWGDSSGGVWPVWQCNSQVGTLTQSRRVWSV